MKKLLYGFIIALCSLVLMGCGKEMTAKEAVADYLENYITLDSHIVEQLDEFVDNEDLTNDQKLLYKEILKKEYSSLTYDIQNERYEKDVAYVTTKINVIDLYNAQQEALKYYNEHIEEFNNDAGIYDKTLFMNYKLKQMKDATKTINYEIEFKVVKNGNDWDVTQLSSEDLEKIHGIYNYKE